MSHYFTGKKTEALARSHSGRSGACVGPGVGLYGLRRVSPSAPISPALNQANKGPGIAGLWEGYEISYHNGNGMTLSKPVALIKASLLLLVLLCYPLVGKPKLRASGCPS